MPQSPPVFFGTFSFSPCLFCSLRCASSFLPIGTFLNHQPGLVSSQRFSLCLSCLSFIKLIGGPFSWAGVFSSGWCARLGNVLAFFHGVRLCGESIFSFFFFKLEKCGGGTVEDSGPFCFPISFLCENPVVPLSLPPLPPELGLSFSVTAQMLWLPQVFAPLQVLFRFLHFSQAVKFNTLLVFRLVLLFDPPCIFPTLSLPPTPHLCTKRVCLCAGVTSRGFQFCFFAPHLTTSIISAHPFSGQEIEIGPPPGTYSCVFVCLVSKDNLFEIPRLFLEHSSEPTTCFHSHRQGLLNRLPELEFLLGADSGTSLESFR